MDIAGTITAISVPAPGANVQQARNCRSVKALDELVVTSHLAAVRKMQTANRSRFPIGEIVMKTRQKVSKKLAQTYRQPGKSRFRIVKLEERIAPCNPHYNPKGKLRGVGHCYPYGHY